MRVFIDPRSLGLVIFAVFAGLAWGHPHPGSDPGGGEDPTKPRASVRAGFYFNGDTDFDDTGSEFGFNEWRIEAPVFGKSVGDLRYSAVARYRFSQMDFTRPEAPLGDQDLHGLELRMDALWQPEGQDWYLWGRLKPESYSDLDSISDGLGVSGILSVGYEFNEGLSLALGGYFGRSFGDYTFYPSLGVIWDISDRWTLRLVPPDLTVTHEVSESFRVLLSAFPGGGSWNIDPEENGGIDRVDYLDVRLAVGCEARFRDNWWWSLWAGGNLFQQVELQAEDGDTAFDDDLRDSLFLYTGLRYDIW